MLKKNVLSNKKDFSAVYNKGKSVGDRYIVVFYKKNNCPYSRLAFVASKKVGNSVKRNRAIRLMKESYRLSEMKIPEGYDVVFIARNTIDGKKCREVQRSLESAIKKTGVIRKNEIHK